MLSSTQQFIDALEAKGIKYEINEPTQSGKDVMTVTYSGDRMPTIRCLFFFDEDCESVAIRVFDILKVPKERTAAIFLTVNALNSKFRFVKFCVHTEDSTVQAEMDASFRDHDVGEICGSCCAAASTSATRPTPISCGRFGPEPFPKMGHRLCREGSAASLPAFSLQRMTLHRFPRFFSCPFGGMRI